MVKEGGVESKAKKSTIHHQHQPYELSLIPPGCTHASFHGGGVSCGERSEHLMRQDQGRDDGGNNNISLVKAHYMVAREGKNWGKFQRCTRGNVPPSLSSTVDSNNDVSKGGSRKYWKYWRYDDATPNLVVPLHSWGGA